MIKKNPKAIAQAKSPSLLVAADKRFKVEQPSFAYLIKEKDLKNENAQSYFEFLVNPEEINLSFSSKWNESGAVGVPKQTLQWSHGTNTVIALNDLVMDTHRTPVPGGGQGLSIAPLLDKLKRLKDREEGQRQPPILYFVHGGRLIGPCVLTDCTIKESAWIGGFPTEARVNIELKEIALPDDNRAILPVSAITADIASLPSTMRAGAVAEGTKETNKWIEANKAKIPGELGKAAKKGTKQYAVSTNPTTGITIMKSGKSSAVVGLYDGGKFYPAATFKDVSKKNSSVKAILTKNPNLFTIAGKKVSELLK